MLFKILILKLFFVVICFNSCNADLGSLIEAAGFKWCGPGSSAINYDDLGEQRKEDACCRDHDHCDDMLEIGEKSFIRKLENNGMITVLHCKCDKKFRDCLKKIGSFWSEIVGALYFGIQKQCYRKEHPIIECKDDKRQISNSRESKDRCLEYVVDKDSPKIWQLIDLPQYQDESDYRVFQNYDEEDEDN